MSEQTGRSQGEEGTDTAPSQVKAVRSIQFPHSPQGNVIARGKSL